MRRSSVLGSRERLKVFARLNEMQKNVATEREKERDRTEAVGRREAKICRSTLNFAPGRKFAARRGDDAWFEGLLRGFLPENAAPGRWVGASTPELVSVNAIITQLATWCKLKSRTKIRFNASLIVREQFIKRYHRNESHHFTKRYIFSGV